MFLYAQIKFLVNAFGLRSRSFTHVSGLGKPSPIVTVKPRWLYFSVCFFFSSFPPWQIFPLCLKRSFISYMTHALPSCFSEPSSSSPLLLLLFYPHCKAGSFFINLSLPPCARCLSFSASSLAQCIVCRNQEGIRARKWKCAIVVSELF